MAVLDCCDASGGRVVITVNGKRFSARSAITIKPTTVERMQVANQDGTVAIHNKAVLPEADLSLSDRCGLDINEIMSCPADVTLDLIDMRRRYLMTKAVVVGRPELNSETGEIRGIKFVSHLVNVTNY